MGRLIFGGLFAILFYVGDSFALDIPLSVKETQGINRTGEMVCNGIPIAKSENITATSSIVITDDAGTQIPATFEILSRWNGSPSDTAKPIQWVLVTFPSSVNANQTATYHLKTGTPGSVASPISISQTASAITVNTGEATFVVSKTALTVFDSIALNGTNLLSGSGGGQSTISGQDPANANAPTLVEIERNNSNYVCIKVEGKYNNTPIGLNTSEPIYYRYRYEFYAGSPTVVVNHKFWWPGQGGAGSAYLGDANDKITVNSIANTLPIMAGLSSVAVYADASTTLSGALSSGTAKVAQRRKTLFADASVAQVTHGVGSTSTTFASRPMLMAKNSNGTIAVSMDHMQRFEPQAMEVTSGGTIKISPLAEGQYFACYQGAWARFSVSALPANATYNDALASNFAPLNSRLFAFPDASYVRSSDVYQSLPVAADGTVASTFINKISAVSDYTKTYFETQKWQGLMTWGSSTRYEYETGVATTWDKIYSGAALTDYHNTFKNLDFNFIYNRNPDLLYDLAFSGARRMLNTQILQPNTSKSSTYMGWGWSGYGMYRADQNSSHSYFENLYNYYYMTGDKEAIDILKIAAETVKFWYTRAPEGSLASQSTYPADWVDYHGRVSMQHASIFNFLGHVDNSAYLDDFEYMFRHAFSTEIALLTAGEKEYAFVSNGTSAPSGFLTQQSWMGAQYFTPLLTTLYKERGDLSLGVNNISISRFLRADANALIDYYAKTPGDGLWGGSWANSLNVNYSGSPYGGTLTSVSLFSQPDLYLYAHGKAAASNSILSAGRILNDSSLVSFGKAGVDAMLANSSFTAAETIPWAKAHGLFFTRLHHAVGNYNDQEQMSSGKRYRILLVESQN